MKLETLNEASNQQRELAAFVEEGLAGLGVLDDADELLLGAYDEEGEEGARAAMNRYNIAISFVNKVLGKRYPLITEDELEEWTS